MFLFFIEKICGYDIICTNKIIQRKRMKFVNLTNHLTTGKEKADLSNLKAKNLGKNLSYKLENAPGLIWCAKERTDEFYSEWESVQPGSTKYAVYYEPKSTSRIVTPEELFGLRNKIKSEIDLKNLVLDYVRKQNPGETIDSVICQVNNSKDVADLHTLFDTPDVSKVVEGYAKSFSAMFWNHVDEKDESFFQVPSLMIMDSNCMDITNRIKTIPYSQRRNGVDKITGTPTKDLNVEEVLKLLNSNINLSSAVDLLKLKRDSRDASVINAINSKLSSFPLLDKAQNIMENDELANQIFIISGKEKDEIKTRILSDSRLQKQLEEKRLSGSDNIDIYLASYVEIVEESNRNKFFKEKSKEIENETIDKSHAISAEDIGRIPRVKDVKRTPVKDWINSALNKFINNAKEK